MAAAGWDGSTLMETTSPAQARGRRDALVRRVASGLRVLRSAARTVETFQLGPQRVRAAAAVLRAGAELDGAIAKHPCGPQLLRPRWREPGLELLEEAFDGAPDIVGVASDHWPTVVLPCLAEKLATGADLSTPQRDRWDFSLRGLGLRGLEAVLFTTATEGACGVEVTLTSACGATARRRAARLSWEGVVQEGACRWFVGGRGEWRCTPELLRSDAWMGDVFGTLFTHARLPHRHQRDREMWRLIAVHHEQPELALRELASRPRREQQRAYAELASKAIFDTFDLPLADDLLDRLAPGPRRARLRHELVRAELMRGRIRPNALTWAHVGVPLLDALLGCEVRLVRGNYFQLEDDLLDVAKLLRQQPRPTWASRLPLARMDPWERALRCFTVLRVAGWWNQFTLPKRIVQHVLGRARFQGLLRGLVKHRDWESQFDDGNATLRELEGALRVAELERRLAASSPARLLSRLDTQALEQALRCETVHAAVVSGALLGSQPENPAEESSPTRSAYDLGRALARRPGPKLAVVARRVLSQRGAPEEVVALRLASLHALEEGSVLDTIAMLLKQAPLAPDIRLLLLRRLAKEDNSQAQHLVFAHVEKITERGEYLEPVLRVLDLDIEGSDSLATSWQSLRRELLRNHVNDAGAWCCGLLREWYRLTRRTPSAQLFWLCRVELQRLGGAAAPPGAELIAGAIERAPGPGRWPQLLIERGFGLDWSVLLQDPYPSQPWSPLQWHSAYQHHTADMGDVDATVVRAVSRSLSGDTQVLFDRLLRGAPPLQELREPASVFDSGFELRYLHKQRDLFSYLRLADCTANCFSSTGGYFNEGMKTARWIYRLWRDPLSFAFHIHRKGAIEPYGFVFGGYADFGVPALLLNGVYLKRRKSTLRMAVLRLIEERLARPIGAGLVGIANCHGGHGEMPQGYRLAKRRGVRHRALRSKEGRLETQIYDDLCNVVNKPVEMELYWKDLTAEATS